MTSARPCTFAIDIAIPRATFALNLRSLFFHSNARILHQAWIDALRCDIRRNPQQTADCNLDWRFLHRLLADDVRMSNIEFRFTNGATVLALHGATFSASEIESGRFAAKQVVVATPLFKKSFADLRGATKWENDRLTVGALSFARGLDIETITADFSRLEKKRIGIELNLDAFGEGARQYSQRKSGERESVGRGGHRFVNLARANVTCARFAESGRRRSARFQIYIPRRYPKSQSRHCFDLG